MSETQTASLTEFLLARFAEDEAVARQARPGLAWDELAFHDLAADDVPHIARHSPARVLAECEAKRRIVEMHRNWPVLVESEPTFDHDDSADPQEMVFRMSKQIAWTTEQKYREHFGSEPPTGPILRALALPYADHPDYRAEWAL